MSALKTRLDHRSTGNSEFQIVHSETGKVIAAIRALSPRAELEIDTLPEFHIEKPSGYSSRK